jgi:hypothetical protein
MYMDEVLLHELTRAPKDCFKRQGGNKANSPSVTKSSSGQGPPSSSHVRVTFCAVTTTVLQRRLTTLTTLASRNCQASRYRREAYVLNRARTSPKGEVRESKHVVKPGANSVGPCRRPHGRQELHNYAQLYTTLQYFEHAPVRPLHVSFD